MHVTETMISWSTGVCWSIKLYQLPEEMIALDYHISQVLRSTATSHSFCFIQLNRQLTAVGNHCLHSCLCSLHSGHLLVHKSCNKRCHCCSNTLSVKRETPKHGWTHATLDSTLCPSHHDAKVKATPSSPET